MEGIQVGISAMKNSWRVPDHRLESIAAGTEDYDGEDVSCMSAELWKLRGETAAKDAIILGLKEAANQLRAERDAAVGALTTILAMCESATPWSISNEGTRSVCQKAIAGQKP